MISSVMWAKLAFVTDISMIIVFLSPGRTRLSVINYDDDDDSYRLNYIYLGDFTPLLNNTLSKRGPIKRSGYIGHIIWAFENIQLIQDFKSLPTLYILSSNWLCLSCFDAACYFTVIYPTSLRLPSLSYGYVSISIFTKKALGSFPA